MLATPRQMVKTGHDAFAGTARNASLQHMQRMRCFALMKLPVPVIQAAVNSGYVTGGRRTLPCWTAWLVSLPLTLQQVPLA